MSTLHIDKIKAIQPGWRIEYQIPGREPEQAIVIQHHEVGLAIVVDGDENAVHYLNYHSLESGDTTLKVIDTTQTEEVEQVDGPWRGLTTEQRLGKMVNELTPDNPVQSGPVNTAHAEPAEYTAEEVDGDPAPPPDSIPLVTIHHAMPVSAVSAILFAVADAFPSATIGEAHEDDVTVIVLPVEAQ